MKLALAWRCLRAALLLAMVCAMGTLVHSAEHTNFVLVIHGGAGIWRKDLTAEREQAAREAMRAALLAGHAILQTNGTSLDAVEAAVRVLEDSPAFNAGKGSVLNADGAVEMDASIIDGTSKRAGAVAAVQFIRNPVSAARAVMEKSAHVMMTGNGAEAFARAQGLAMEPTNYFITPPRQQQWERAKERRAEAGERSSADAIGTVGAVALDARGRLAAATSTGGMLNKKFGRVGDSPIIGAGTYANDATCAVSATGHGEFFIRTVFAHDVSALMEYKNLSLRAAGEEAMRKLSALGGTGGFIAVDKRGEVVMPFNTEGMFRGVIHTNGEPRVAVFPE